MQQSGTIEAQCLCNMSSSKVIRGDELESADAPGQPLGLFPGHSVTLRVPRVGDCEKQDSVDNMAECKKHSLQWLAKEANDCAAAGKAVDPWKNTFQEQTISAKNGAAVNSL